MPTGRKQSPQHIANRAAVPVGEAQRKKLSEIAKRRWASSNDYFSRIKRRVVGELKHSAGREYIRTEAGTWKFVRCTELINCPFCEKPFLPLTPHQKRCSEKCQRKNRNRTNHAQYGRNPEFAMRVRLRNRIRKMLGRRKNYESTIKIVGCDLQTLTAHLESQFVRGMSWANRSAWEIDHIRPCADFDMNEPEQVLRCFHFSNLRPAWKDVNRAKGAKIITHQPELIFKSVSAFR